MATLFLLEEFSDDGLDILLRCGERLRMMDARFSVRTATPLLVL